jgi:hypothetical protein
LYSSLYLHPDADPSTTYGDPHAAHHYAGTDRNAYT